MSQSYILPTITLIMLISGCGGDSTASSPQPGVSKPTLQPFASEQALETYLKEGMKRSTQVGRYQASEAATANDNAAKVSTTNLQKIGVDEADRIKSDGNYLYILGMVGASQGLLRVMTLSDTPEATEVSRLSINTPVSLEGGYLLTQRSNGLPNILVAVGGKESYYYGWEARAWFSTWDWQSGKTEVHIINVTNQPMVDKKVHLDGYLVASRRIGETLYLVSRYTPAISGYLPYPTDDQKAHNDALLEQASLNDLLPNWYLDDVDQGELVGANTCFQSPLPENYQTADLITVTAIDLTNVNKKPVSQCLTGASETIYASPKALYLATTRYYYGIQTREITYPSQISTDIHKFILSDTGPNYRGSGTVEGHLGWEQDKKSFRMGEHQGVIRVVTSLGKNWDNTATTRLTLLEEGSEGTLRIISQLPNEQRPKAIGKPGERLYAARFLGTRGYLVTFRVTDPLYILDLSNANDPFITGELEIEGYSDYLHPIGDTLLLGIGKEAKVDEGTGGPNMWRGAWYQGVKLSLFDISNPKNPQELDNKVIGKRGTESAALLDHHAFAYLPADQDNPARLALPIELHENGPTSGDSSQPWAYYGWSHTGLYLFDIKADKIEMKNKMIVEQGTQNTSQYQNNDRALIRNNGVHYVHDNQVWSAPWVGGNMVGPR